MNMEFYHRNLPHWQPHGASIFLTWRLYGSLPSAKSTAKPLGTQISFLGTRETFLAG